MLQKNNNIPWRGKIREHGWVYLTYVLLALLFLPAIKAGMVADFTGFVERLVEHPEDSIFKKYGYYSIQWVTSVCMYIPYVLWDLHRDLWGLYFLGLHGIAAILIYHVVLNLKYWWQVPHLHEIAIFSGIAFLIHPYQVEPVVWEACISYLLCVILMSSSWICAASDSMWKNALSYLFFFLSLMTIELSFTFPLILFILYFLSDEREDWIEVTYSTVLKAGPYFLVFLVYLGLNRLVEGEFIGHYGPRVHLRVDLLEMTSNISKYFYKNLLFIRHWPHPMKEAAFTFLSGWKGIMALLIPFLTLLHFSGKKTSRILLFAALGFALAILPVSNLYFSILLLGENDRYGYWGMFFFSFLLSFLLFKRGTWFGRSVLGVFVILSVFFTFNLTQYWGQSEDLRKRLLEQFPKNIEKPVLLLNTPDNYKGLWMLRDVGQGSGVYDALTYIEQRQDIPKMQEVYQYNLNSSTDGCSASWLDNGQLRIELNQWGCWYWNDGIGGVNMDNDIYTTRIDGPCVLSRFQSGSQSIRNFHTGWRSVDSCSRALINIEK